MECASTLVSPYDIIYLVIFHLMCPQDWPLWEESVVLGRTLCQNIQQAARRTYVTYAPKPKVMCRYDRVIVSCYIPWFHFNFLVPPSSPKKRAAFFSFPPRQKSSLQMNRKLTWEQNPPNMDDYGSECFEKPGVFQLTPSLAPPADDDGKKPKSTPKSLKMESGPSGTKGTAGKHVPGKTAQFKGTSGEGC